MGEPIVYCRQPITEAWAVRIMVVNDLKFGSPEGDKLMGKGIIVGEGGSPDSIAVHHNALYHLPDHITISGQTVGRLHSEGLQSVQLGASARL